MSRIRTQLGCQKSKIQWSAENQTFGLANLTHLCSNFRRSDFRRSVCSVHFFSAKLDHFIYIYIYIYNGVGYWEKLNRTNQILGTERLKSELFSSYFRRLVRLQPNQMQKRRNPNVRISDVYCYIFCVSMVKISTQSNRSFCNFWHKNLKTRTHKKQFF